MYNVLRLLAREFEVTGLFFVRREERPSPEDIQAGLAGLDFLAGAEAFPLPQQWSGLRWLADHSRSILLHRAYTWYTYDSAPARHRLQTLLATTLFDVVHLDSLDLAAYLPALQGIPVACTHHNVESALLARRARTERHLLRRTYMAYQAELLAALEREWCGEVALNVCVSTIDADLLRRAVPTARCVVAPNGADIERLSPTAQPPEVDLLGVGGLNWTPNREGLELLCEEILPVIRRTRPGVSVRWVGRATDAERKWYRERHGIELTGYVEDVRPAFASAACVVAPLRSGGGTRLKVIDAWAMGKALVSTTIGSEGLDAKDGVNVLIADDPAAFAAATLRLLEDGALRDRLGRAARATVESTYAWDVVGGPMLEAYRALVRRAPLTPAMRP
jgi:glycosyltransferase involved in cell wall biosynthesis